MTAQELQEAHAMWEELDAADWRDTSVAPPHDRPMTKGGSNPPSNLDQ
jgi:hypothetical protein